MRCYMVSSLYSLGLCISVYIAQSFFSLPCAVLLLLLLIPSNLPFTQIFLSTSLSCCAIVPQSLLLPAAKRTQGYDKVQFIALFNLSHRAECFWLQLPQIGFLESQVSRKKSSVLLYLALCLRQLKRFSSQPESTSSLNSAALPELCVQVLAAKCEHPMVKRKSLLLTEDISENCTLNE